MVSHTSTGCRGAGERSKVDKEDKKEEEEREGRKGEEGKRGRWRGKEEGGGEAREVDREGRGMRAFPLRKQVGGGGGWALEFEKFWAL